MYKSIIINSNNITDSDTYISNIIAKHNLSSTNNPDLLLIQNDGNKVIGIKQIRNLIDWAVLKPYNSQIKIGIIKSAESLTPQAQNALLKTLEEPNKYTQIYLLTQNHKQLLPTILSRCELHYFSTNTTDTTKQELSLSEEFLQLSTTQKFVYAETIFKIKDIQQQFHKIETLLINLIYYYKNNYYANISSNNIWNTIFISETLKKLHANVPKKLILTNLIINLK